jgi:hypothetical protein
VWLGRASLRLCRFKENRKLSASLTAVVGRYRRRRCTLAQRSLAWLEGAK